MFLLRGLFPSFEKPVERQRYLNIEPQRRDFRGIGTVLGLAAFCGLALALWEPSHTATTPVVAAATQPGPAPADANKAASLETTAAAEVEDDQPAPTVKLSSACAQKATARRDCAGVKALKEARLKAPEPTASKPVQAPPATVKEPSANQAAPVAVAAKPTDTASAANAQTEAPNAQPQQRMAAAQKAKRSRVQHEEAPLERLVRIYDQVLPDGRRVPVYRRVGGGYETGTIIDGEYRPSRRANLEPPYSARYFGLQ
jgi:hypothetical protein